MPYHTWIDRLGVRAPQSLILLKCLFDGLCEIGRTLRVTARMWLYLLVMPSFDVPWPPAHIPLALLVLQLPPICQVRRIPGNYMSSLNLYGRASASIVYSLPKTFRLVPETYVLAILYVFPQLFSPPQGRIFVPPIRVIFNPSNVFPLFLPSLVRRSIKIPGLLFTLYALR